MAATFFIYILVFVGWVNSQVCDDPGPALYGFLKPLFGLPQTGSFYGVARPFNDASTSCEPEICCSPTTPYRECCQNINPCSQCGPFERCDCNGRDTCGCYNSASNCPNNCIILSETRDLIFTNPCTSSNDPTLYLSPSCPFVDCLNSATICNDNADCRNNICTLCCSNNQPFKVPLGCDCSCVSDPGCLNLPCGLEFCDSGCSNPCRISGNCECLKNCVSDDCSCYSTNIRCPSQNTVCDASNAEPVIFLKKSCGSCDSSPISNRFVSGNIPCCGYQNVPCFENLAWLDSSNGGCCDLPSGPCLPSSGCGPTLSSCNYPSCDFQAIPFRMNNYNIDCKSPSTNCVDDCCISSSNFECSNTELGASCCSQCIPSLQTSGTSACTTVVDSTITNNLINTLQLMVFSGLLETASKIPGISACDIPSCLSVMAPNLNTLLNEQYCKANMPICADNMRSPCDASCVSTCNTCEATCQPTVCTPASTAISCDDCVTSCESVSKPCDICPDQTMPYPVIPPPCSIVSSLYKSLADLILPQLVRQPYQLPPPCSMPPPTPEYFTSGFDILPRPCSPYRNDMYGVSIPPIAAEIMVPTSIPASLMCANMGNGQNSLPIVAINVDPANFEIC